MGKHLDPQVLAGLKQLQTDSDSNLIAELVSLFLDSTPKHLDRIQHGIRTGDAKLIQHEAHTLKSGCANLGASEMAVVCARLEENARLGKLDRAPADLAELKRLYPAVSTELVELKSAA